MGSAYRGAEKPSKMKTFIVMMILSLGVLHCQRAGRRPPPFLDPPVFLDSAISGLIERKATCEYCPPDMPICHGFCDSTKKSCDGICRKATEEVDLAEGCEDCLTDNSLACILEHGLTKATVECLLEDCKVPCAKTGAKELCKIIGDINSSLGAICCKIIGKC